MATAPKSRIAPDDALVIDLRDLGIVERGPELEKLFAKFCSRNSQSSWQYEFTPEGEIIAMPPVNHPGGLHENDTATELNIWTRDFGGMATGSNAFYRMPITGGVLVPDAAWVSPGRLAEHPPVPGEPIPICPDFVVEIRSGTGNLAPLHAKMRLYIQNGALLGWLIDAHNRRVYIYRAGQTEPELLENPTTLSGEDILPGFIFDVARWIFNRVYRLPSFRKQSGRSSMPEYLVNLRNTAVVTVHMAEGCGDAKRFGNAASPDCKPWWQPLGDEYVDMQRAVEAVPGQFQIPLGTVVEPCQNCP